MMTEKKTPRSVSSDHAAMTPYWSKVAAIMGGTTAMRAAGETYLPKFSGESREDYDFRRMNARFTNIFGDIVETLSAKPFAREISVSGAGPQLEPLLEDIDGQGNHIHVVAAGLFHAGVVDAITWVLVDFRNGLGAGATLAQERAAGARPAWVVIPARRVIAVYSEMIGGVETIVHARICEETTERDGWGEKEVERIRVFDRALIRDEQGAVIGAAPATWSLYEEKKRPGAEPEWIEIQSGAISIEVVPLVPFITGRRHGSSWCVRPALRDAADLQIEHFQQESGLKHALALNNFTMLAGNGVAPPVGADGKPLTAPVGPMTVLYAPPNADGQHGEWRWLQVETDGMKFAADHIKSIEMQIRELGRQPLTAQSGNITTITAAFAGDKAHTVIEAWAINCKDALERALGLTERWLGETAAPEVEIQTDFSLDLRDDDGSGDLIEARKNGDLSQATLWDELKRRGKLSPNFDPDEERKRLLEEAPGEPTPEELAALDATNTDMAGGNQADPSEDPSQTADA